MEAEYLNMVIGLYGFNQAQNRCVLDNCKFVDMLFEQNLVKGGNMLNLRTIKDSDVDRIIDWITQDYVSKWFGNPDDWKIELLGRNEKYNFIKHFILEEDGNAIGFCQYYNWNCIVEDELELERDNSFGIDYLIGDESLIGKGLGKKVIKLICDKVIETEESVFQFIADPTMEEGRTNVASIKVLEANGFYIDDNRQVLKKVL